MKPGSNVDDFINEARTILNQIDTLPEIAEEPELSRIRTRFPVITLTLYGELPEAQLYSLAEDVRKKMQKLPGIAGIGVAGDQDWEIWVEVDPHRLAALNISHQEIILAIRNNLRDQPGGSIKSQDGDIRLRGIGILPEVKFIEQIALRTNADGAAMLLGNIANISRRFEEAQTYARFNGQSSVNLTATKTADASTIKVSARIKEFAKEIQKTLPANVKIDYHTDMSAYVKVRLNTRYIFWIDRVNTGTSLTIFTC